MFDLTTKLPATMHTEGLASERLCVAANYWSGLGLNDNFSNVASNNVAETNQQDPIKMASFYKVSSV